MEKKLRKLIIWVFLINLCVCILFLYFLLPVLWLKVDQAFHRGDYERAVEYLSFISHLNPKDPQPYILKAWLCWSEARVLCLEGRGYKDKLNQAIRTYREGQKHNPENWQLYFEEGIMWESFGEREKSLNAYYKASLYSPSPYNRIYKIKSEKFKVKIK